VVRQVKLSEPEIALELLSEERLVLVAEMMDDDVGLHPPAAEPLQARQNLLVNAVLPPDLWMIWEKPNKIRGSVSSGRRRSQGQAGHEIADLLAGQARK
jgi:hypothetical protein